MSFTYKIGLPDERRRELKLRILGNSIRLRISKRELAELAASGDVADAIEFMPGVSLTYRLRAGTAGAIAAAFQGREIVITVAAGDVSELAGTERVSIRGEQALAHGDSLQILVEKDFECLVPRPGEDPRDLFDNPAKA
jgi:hypothetical protein